MLRLHLLFLAVLFTGCAALDPLLDAPVQAVDPTTGVTTSTSLGDVIADNAAPVANTIGSVLGGVNPLLGLLATGAVGTLLAGARRKRKELSDPR